MFLNVKRCPEVNVFVYVTPGTPPAMPSSATRGRHPGSSFHIRREEPYYLCATRAEPS
jgi:hypothetical protein